MHRDLLFALVANVRKRASEGDCPTIPSYPVEALENAIIDLAKHEAPAEGAGERGAPLTFTPFRDELREAQAALEPFSFIAERRSLSPATTVHLVHLDGTHIETLEVNSFWRARHAHSALRARSSAPEARSGEGQ